MSFVYRHVTVDRVIDGDTVMLSIDMGNKITWTDSFRLMGIDTPERGKPGFTEATEYLTTLLSSGVSRIETFKPDKYGRWLVSLWIFVTGGELHINEAMVTAGYANAYFGGKK